MVGDGLPRGGGEAHGVHRIQVRTGRCSKDDDDGQDNEEDEGNVPAVAPSAGVEQALLIGGAGAHVTTAPADEAEIGGVEVVALLAVGPAAGAIFEDAEVVVDWNLVTSRRPEDLPAFCRACIKVLAAGPVFPK